LLIDVTDLQRINNQKSKINNESLIKDRPIKN